MHQPIHRPISTNTLREGKVSLKYWCSISEVLVNHQEYRPIGVSVDTSVYTWPMYRPILDQVLTDTWSSVDWCICWYIDWCVCRNHPKDTWSQIITWGGKFQLYLTSHFCAGVRDFDSNVKPLPYAPPPPSTGLTLIGALLILANLFLIFIFQLLLLIMIPRLKKIKIFLSFLWTL